MITQEANGLLQDLARARIALAANGGELQVRAPRGVMTQALRSEIRKHKAALLAALQSNDPEHKPGAHVGATAQIAPTVQTPPPWAGQRVRIEDLPEFKARWGLQATGGAWPEDAPCPRLGFQEVQAGEQWPEQKTGKETMADGQKQNDERLDSKGNGQGSAHAPRARAEPSQPAGGLGRNGDPGRVPDIGPNPKRGPRLAESAQGKERAPTPG